MLEEDKEKSVDVLGRLFRRADGDPVVGVRESDTDRLIQEED